MSRLPYLATAADHAAEFAAFMRLNRPITTLRPEPPDVPDPFGGPIRIRYEKVDGLWKLGVVPA